MADMDKYADEMLSDDELDNVAGGTTQETCDIINHIGLVKDGKYERKLGLFEVADYLKKSYNIDAQIYFDTDYLGTGLDKKANTYSHEGKPLSHQQVINIIRAYNS